MAVNDDEELYLAQLAQMESQIEAFTLRLEKVLRKGLQSLLDRVQEGDQEAIAVAAQLGSLQSSLKGAGLDLEKLGWDAIYANEIVRVAKFLAASGAKAGFSDIDKNLIRALVEFDRSSVGQNVAAYIQDFTGQVMRGVLTGQAPDFSTLADATAEKVQRVLYTDIRTSVLSFERTISARAAIDAGFENFRYIGPDDKITRPFCRALLERRNPPIYTLDEINQMTATNANGQALDVFTACGGYNCRHNWGPTKEAPPAGSSEADLPRGEQ